MTTSSRLAPILLYGLDIPFVRFTAAAHGNYKFNYITDRNDVHFKFFEQPIFIQAHAIVRIPKDRYGKMVVSILDDESAFIRTVESNVLANVERVITMAEPLCGIEQATLKSVLYENLLKVKIGKTVGQDVNGSLIPFEEHEKVLVKGVKVLMTVEVNGMYHSPVSKGVTVRIHSYRVVESF